MWLYFNLIFIFIKVDHSRVNLLNQTIDEGDYINANFIPVSIFYL